MGLPGPNVVDGSTSFANGVIPGNAFQFPLTQPGLGDFNDGVRGDNGFGDGRGFLGSSTGGIRGETDFGSDYGVRGIHTGGNVAVRADGNSETTGTKSFVQPHPTDATLQIVFISAEGPESYTNGPPDDAARVQVEHDRQIQPALPRPDEGDVGGPPLVCVKGGTKLDQVAEEN